MNYSIIYEAVKRRHPTIKEFLSLGGKFGSAYHWHYTLFFHGRLFRDGRTERVLLKLVRDGRLHAEKYINNRLVKRGEIPSIRISERRIIVPESMLTKWLATRLYGNIFEEAA